METLCRCFVYAVLSFHFLSVFVMRLVHFQASLWSLTDLFSHELSLSNL